MARTLATTLVLFLAACTFGEETVAPKTRRETNKTIHILAGTGVSGAAGDGGPGQNAQVGNPFGVVIGPDGALYICEVDTHRIRRLDLQRNIISTFAGSGRRGYSGDGETALNAELNEPYEVCFSKNGDMYFVEMRNHIVRKVEVATGTISTVVGTGEAGYSGDGSQATEAQLHDPHSIAIYGQFLYIADIKNHRIRQVDLASGVINTFAGTGEQAPTPDGAHIKTAPLNGPRAITFNLTGDMFLALREGNAVYRIDMKSKTLHHIAGTGEKGYAGDGGHPQQALLSGPKGISIGPSGMVYIADTENHTIRRIDLSKELIETMVGDGRRHDGLDGNPHLCGLARPHGIFVAPGGAVYIGDSENHRVRVLR